MTETKKDRSHAEQNAEGWMETIRELVACLDADRDRLEELRDERDAFTFDVDDNAAPDGPGYANDAEAWAGENPDDAEELAQLEAAVKIEGEELDEDKARERIQESPLSVQVRGDWHDPGAEDEGATEFMILLTTGGPALRICGDLDNDEPTRAYLQYQDWGTPWTDYIVTGSDAEALLAFCRVFYFGS